MMKTGMKGMSAGVVMILFLAAFPSWVLAAEEKASETISAVLQSSALSKEDQAAVQARADAAVTAGLPKEDVAIIVTRAVKHGMDSGMISRFLDAGRSAKKAGLPAGPVLDRIEQGLSKGVAGERIAAAAHQLTEKLAIAQPIVDNIIQGGVKPGRAHDREEAIEAAARALEKSIPAEDVKRMGEAVHNRKGTLSVFSSAANAAAYFAGNGMSAKTASHLVQGAVDKGYSAGDLDGMVKQMADEMMRGGKAEDAAARMEHEDMRGGRGAQGEMGPGRGMEGGSGMGGGHRR